MVKLSYIVPFYNAKKYFAQCIDSLYCQDLQEDEFEIIVVDDCSNDDESVSLLDTIQSQHTNIKVIHNEQNLRAGGSRDQGLKHAIGTYLWFIDADDKIAEHCVKYLLEIMESDKLDYLTFNYLMFGAKNQPESLGVVTENTPIMTGLEYAHNVCQGDIWSNKWTTAVWNNIYRRDFYMQYAGKFSSGAYGEEMGPCIRILMHASRMRAVSTPYYLYRLNEESVVHTELLVGGRALFDASLGSGSILLDCAKETQNIDTYFANNFHESAVWRINTFTKGLLRITPTEKRIFYKYVHLNASTVNQLIPLLSRTNRLLLKYSFVPFVLYPFNCIFRKLRNAKN